MILFLIERVYNNRLRFSENRSKSIAYTIIGQINFAQKNNRDCAFLGLTAAKLSIMVQSGSKIMEQIMTRIFLEFVAVASFVFVFSLIAVGFFS